MTTATTGQRVRLACAGRIQLAEIDTTHFVGNSPGWLTLTTSDGAELLPRTALQPDTRHRFVLSGAVTDDVRIDVFPDGGLGRVRLFGEPTQKGREALGLRFLNALPDGHADRALTSCCRAPAWVAAVRDARPVEDLDALLTRSDEATMSLDESGFAAALAGHPRIGERSQSSWSRQEQSGVGDDTREQLLAANVEYEERFGHVYLVCATGLSGEELLAICRGRLAHDPESERQVALAELAKINRIRLHKLLGTAS